MMGEAKKRGTYDERVAASVAASVAKREARELAWNKAQAARRDEHLAEKQVIAVRPAQRRVRPAFVLAAALAIAAASTGHR